VVQVGRGVGIVGEKKREKALVELFGTIKLAMGKPEDIEDLKKK
jgi:hypothetical protein